MQKRDSGRRMVALLVATTCLAAPAAVCAQERTAADAGASGNGEIVVTAQRRAESILKVPVAVTAMSQDDLLKQGVTNTAQMTGMVPSLQVNSPYGDSQPNFTIRGVGVANEHNPNQASPVGVYFDDAYIAARAVHGCSCSIWSAWKCCAGRKGRCTAATPPAARSISSPRSLCCRE
ncbi:hypothetical protein GCM10011614_11150 [Novosphingobium colocasiae]|uniref:TonB-dependent receptor plug domain-containing protein n=1 Tax=Novosphingobium colocasiae TaxID=1256513 RepID=A0A918UEK4_9SPHN|nr:Plug domain-containing protein [Novosphingobium colocasiae]GGY97818.1 hypothetical protein GCM10011614_11150 [Novosphingobium colocasiae]